MNGWMTKNHFQLNSDVHCCSLEPDVDLSTSLSLVTLFLRLLCRLVLLALQCLLDNLLVKHHVEVNCFVCRLHQREGSQYLSHEEGLWSHKSGGSHEHVESVVHVYLKLLLKY